MSNFHRIISGVGLFVAVCVPSPTLADTSTASLPSNLVTLPIRSIEMPLLAAPFRARDLFALNSRYLTPSQIEPYGVVDQNNVRETRYRNPMHCPMSGLLTPAQMNAAVQACSDTFYHVDHSG